ncbi:hypothetical protein [Rhodopseudomonas telluris]|uniref:CobQ/CobB/MinD/ParA nucleotide binding domain-containing protein n=1 Tax=Rhodopseudomonas telluris TaxID=644215 RepID=A0ABV6EWN4_9BRAD
MPLRIHLVAGFHGGSGRSLTAALLAYGLHLQARRTLLVRQTYDGSVSAIDPVGATLPFPCTSLLLHPPFELTTGVSIKLAAAINQADARFLIALKHLAIAEVGADGDVVVDLCCHDRACNRATMRGAAVIIVPVRTSVLEIDWAFRSFSHFRDKQRKRRTPVPTLLAAIAPDRERDHQKALLDAMLRESDPERELMPAEPADLIEEVPFLDSAALTALLFERSIWQDPQLMERCRAFAAAVAVHADAYVTRMKGDADDL